MECGGARDREAHVDGLKLGGRVVAVGGLAERLSAPVVGAARHTPFMAYDVELANRIREIVSEESGLSEQRMFGGLAFLIHGHMAVAASGQGGLLLRINPDEGESLVETPGVELFMMRGREMKGWLRVDSEAAKTDDELRGWVDRGVAYVRSLPPK